MSGKIRGGKLDRTFAALADPTRRALLARLAKRPGLPVSVLAAPFEISLPAILKHLDVLSGAGLVARTKSGRTVICRLTPAPMQGAINWLNRYEQFWTDRIRRLAMILEEEPMWPSNAQSASHVPSKRRVKHLRRLDRREKNKAYRQAKS
jgi:DNA-binding transcriptional ArsR family regulator